MKKIINIALALSLSALCLMSTACQGGDSGKKSENTEGKTVIKVATYNGGLGLGWLSEAGARFARQYEDRQFEDGKTGVYVDVVESLAGDMLANK